MNDMQIKGLTSLSTEDKKKVSAAALALINKFKGNSKKENSDNGHSASTVNQARSDGKD